MNSIYADIASVAAVKGSFGSPLFSPENDYHERCKHRHGSDLPNFGDSFQKT